MHALVTAIQATGEIVQLVLTPSPAMLAEQARVTSQHEGQKPVHELHVTLGLFNGASQAQIPQPPAQLEFEARAEMVSREDKTSTYLRVTPATAELLAAYVQALEKALGITGFYNPDRLFHASLSNLTGKSRGSIAKVWEHQPTST